MIGDQAWFTALALGVAGSNALYVAVVCVATEFVAPVERITVRERIPGLLMQITGGALSAAVILPASWLWQQLGLEPYQIPLWSWLEPLGSFRFATQILLILLITDFLRYWRHRAEHRWFWPIHAVHHSPTKLHAANSLGHPLQTVPEILFVTLPMSWLVFDGPATPASVMFVSSFLTAYIHSPTEVHFGGLRRLVVDNRFHRIHHSIEQRHFDKNYGICFSLWDWLFGTAHWPKANEWPDVGLDGIDPPKNVRGFLRMPLDVLRGQAKSSEATEEGNKGDSPALT